MASRVATAWQVLQARRGTTISTGWPDFGAQQPWLQRKAAGGSSISRCWNCRSASTFGQRSHPKVIELAEKLDGMMHGADVEGVLQQLRLRGERQCRQLVSCCNNAIGRPHKKKIIGQMIRDTTASRWRPAACAACLLRQDFDLPIPTCVTPTARTTGAMASPARASRICLPHGGEPRCADRARRSWDSCRVHRGTGAGCRWRGDPAAHVFCQDPGGVAQTRRAVHCR